MSVGAFGSNYKTAKEKADEIDNQIIETLVNGHSFVVEAGAGTGKTYSLLKVIDWLQSNRTAEMSDSKKVVCITYTNAAVNVISQRLSNDSYIIPTTIHSFAWNSIKQFQSYLIKTVTDDVDFQITDDDGSEITEVTYTLGHRYKEKGIYYLYHDDVLKLFCRLLDNEKFRYLFCQNYKLILIDEYQDSNKPIMDAFIEYFISSNKGLQFALFGDSWQTIYSSNNVCGKIEHTNLKVIKKVSNFRSAPKIVEVLNKLRKDLPQISAIDDFDGKTVVITNDDFSGPRRTDKYFLGDLPVEVLKERLGIVINYIKGKIPANESLKVLMITHKVLAAQQGYENLLSILNDDFKDKTDDFLIFFSDVVEPVYKALVELDMTSLFETLGVKYYPIKYKSDKAKWIDFKNQMECARKKKTIDVLELCISSKLIPINPSLEEWYDVFINYPSKIYKKDTSIYEFLNLDYSEFIAANDFLNSDAMFSTEHGSKGEEYDNVLFVISKGWNNYQFEKYAPMITGQVSVPNDKHSSYIRNRNLFYVSCSRARKRLFFFITPPVDEEFHLFLENLVGYENIITYNDIPKT